MPLQRSNTCTSELAPSQAPELQPEVPISGSQESSWSSTAVKGGDSQPSTQSTDDTPLHDTQPNDSDPAAAASTPPPHPDAPHDRSLAAVYAREASDSLALAHAAARDGRVFRANYTAARYHPPTRASAPSPDARSPPRSPHRNFVVRYGSLPEGGALSGDVMCSGSHDSGHASRSHSVESSASSPALVDVAAGGTLPTGPFPEDTPIYGPPNAGEPAQGGTQDALHLLHKISDQLAGLEAHLASILAAMGGEGGMRVSMRLPGVVGTDGSQSGSGRDEDCMTFDVCAGASTKRAGIDDEDEDQRPRKRRRLSSGGESLREQHYGR